MNAQAGISTLAFLAHGNSPSSFNGQVSISQAWDLGRCRLARPGTRSLADRFSVNSPPWTILISARAEEGLLIQNAPRSKRRNTRQPFALKKSFDKYGKKERDGKRGPSPKGQPLSDLGRDLPAAPGLHLGDTVAQLDTFEEEGSLSLQVWTGLL